MMSDAVRGAFEGIGLLPSRPTPPPQPEPREEAGFILDVIETHPVDLSEVDIILYEINERAGYREWLVPTLREMVAQRAGRRHMDRLRVVRTRHVFEEGDFFRVDGHMKPATHKKVALHLAEFI
jgi:hypothetical protein